MRVHVTTGYIYVCEIVPYIWKKGDNGLGAAVALKLIEKIHYHLHRVWFDNLVLELIIKTC